VASISPRLASELAERVYQIRSPDRTGNYALETSAELRQSFEFDVSAGPIRGVSGGLFGLYRKTSGFAMIGHGKGQFQGDHVIAIRGTKAGQDWLTNGNVGMSTCENGATVHAGFNKTFSTMKPLMEMQLNSHLRSSGNGTVHCVGHSLGGALASLAADWIKSYYCRPVNLYTFGSPRVGLNGFATKTTSRIDNIYRCTHGADPVPMVPLWPFIHAPNRERGEYRLDQGQGISVSAHFMGVDANPGYRNTAKGDEWGALQRSSMDFLNQPVRLRYESRHEASFTAYWAEKINAALVTLLKDAGYYSAVVAQAGIGTSLTFYDMLARTLEHVAKASTRFATQVRGLLGHMLVFARQGSARVVDLSFQFIRWVFDKTLGALYRSVKQALDGV